MRTNLDSPAERALVHLVPPAAVLAQTHVPARQKQHAFVASLANDAHLLLLLLLQLVGHDALPLLRDVVQGVLQSVLDVPDFVQGFVLEVEAHVKLEFPSEHVALLPEPVARGFSRDEILEKKKRRRRS